MNRLLWVGCVPSHVGGQSRVALYSIKELKKLGWDVHACGKGTQVLHEGESEPCPSYTFNEYDPQTLYSCIDKVKPDVILFSHDIWLFYLLPDLRIKYPHIKVVGWWTIDTHPIHQSWMSLLKACDRVLVPTEFGKRVIYERYPEKHVSVIPYGVDLENYAFPSVPKSELKSWFLQTNNLPAELSDYCFFTFVGANQVKKNVGAMIDAFSSGKFEKAVLVLALKMVPSQVGPFQFDGEYDLKDLVGFPNIFVIASALDDVTHRKFLQMSDFFLYPSQGESPGLQMSEAQLCGCIPIATNYTGLPEESCYSEFLIDKFQFHRGQFNCFRAMVSAESLCEKMEEAYSLWQGLQAGVEADNAWYQSKKQQVLSKFENRTWQNTAKGLHEALLATLNGAYYDSELIAI